MNILLALVPISLVLLLVAIGAFLWAVRRGQFDDLDTPSLDILGDDERPAPAPGRDPARDTRPNAPPNTAPNTMHNAPHVAPHDAPPPRQDD